MRWFSPRFAMPFLLFTAAFTSPSLNTKIGVALPPAQDRTPQ